jgi:hypothetical protein
MNALRWRVAQRHQHDVDRPTIAATLHAEGWRPAKRRQTCTADRVGSLVLRQGLGSGRPKRGTRVERQANEWTLTELTQALEIPPPTLYTWLRKGDMRARQVRHASAPGWLIGADATELERLRAFRRAPRPQRWPAPMRTLEREEAQTRPLGSTLSHDSTGQEAALTRLR